MKLLHSPLISKDFFDSRGARQRRTQTLHLALLRCLSGPRYDHDPDAIWRLYTAICLRGLQGDVTAEEISPETHRRVLAAVAPSHAMLARKRRRQKAVKRANGADREVAGEEWQGGKELFGLVAPRVHHQAFGGSGQLAESAASRGMRTGAEYARKVDFVLQQLAKAAANGNKEATLTLRDYNAILEQASITSSHGLVTSTWRRLTASPGVRPDEDSYRWYLLGMRNYAHRLAQSRLHFPDSREATDRSLAYAADSALSAVKEMAREGLRVKDELLFWTASIMVPARRLDVIKMIVKARFGLDLGAKKELFSGSAAANSVFQADALTAALFTTLIDALGELSTVSDMVGAFEALRAQQLGELAGVNAAASVNGEGQQDVVELKTDFAGVFKSFWAGDSDEANGDPSSSSAATLQATAAVPEMLDLRRVLLPTTATYRNLIRHACIAPSDLTDAAKSKMATTPAPPSPEAEARERNQYQPLARYLIDDALDAYEVQLYDLARKLGAVVRREEFVEPATESGDDNSVASPRRFFFTISFPTPAAPLSFHPTFDVPLVTPSRDFLAPLRGRAARRQSSFLLDYILQRSERARSLLALEQQLLSDAAVHWRQVFYGLSDAEEQQNRYTSRASQRRLRRFFGAMADREASLGMELEGLQAWTEEKVVGQLGRLKLKRIERQERRNARAEKRGEVEEWERAEREVRVREGKEKARVEWERKQAQQQQQQEAAVLGEEQVDQSGEGVVRASSVA